MTEFWEKAFSSNEKMWGNNAVDNAYAVLELLKQEKAKDILIPGFGYGRNAKVFHDAGIKVSGIEISETAILKARKQFDNETIIHHGSVNNMPYDDVSYDAIYSYSLIHLLNQTERMNFLYNCYQQLKKNGLLVTVALSVNDHRYGMGNEIAQNTFMSPNGLSLYFYDEAAIKTEFMAYNIEQVEEITEPNKPNTNPFEKMWMVVCRKQ